MIRALLLAMVLAACQPSAGDTDTDYLTEYGGSAAVYAEIAADTDCANLQATFDRAAGNNDTAEPGSPEALWTTGYMTAANDRREELGC